MFIIFKRNQILISLKNTKFKVQPLVDSGAVLDVKDLDGCTALFHAARGKHIEVMSYLITKGRR